MRLFSATRLMPTLTKRPRDRENCLFDGFQPTDLTVSGPLKTNQNVWF